jgi:hypothetical protein
MRAIVINCSAGHYNLGAAKLASWLRQQGHHVDEAAGDPGPLFTLGYDLVCLSVIFSWHARTAREIAWRVKPHSEVWCGGPGMFALAKWWHDETGLDMVRGLDARFEHQPGDYRMTFASRGCPVNCYFCIVPRLEGTTFTLNWDFRPAPILCDNNLSALPVDFQEHIIRRYQEAGVRLADANSGFEPRYFDEGCYQRWRPILRGPWRFAFDEMREAEAVERMMRILKSESAKRKQVYVLIGNEPPAACYERAMKVIEWGGEPYCQPLIQLNALEKTPKVAHGWQSAQQLRDLARFFNRHLWRKLRIADYYPRKHEARPFAQAAWAA